MKIESHKIPKSSFLSIEKDFAIIINKLLESERLKKLLFYNTRDALDKDNLTQAQSLELLQKNIKIVPKYHLQETLENYLVITFDNFSPSANPEFRNNLIMIDIVCHVDQWLLKDFQLRPFKIAGEIDALLNEQKLTGIGKLLFASCNQVTVNNDYISLCITYQAIHGEEDKIHMLNPQDELQFIEDFDEIYNND